MDFSTIEDGKLDGDETPVFRYSREERLKHAPKNVQDYYNGTFMPRRGLLRSIVSTKGNRFMLMSVGLCIGVVLLASVLMRRESAVVAGIGARLSVFSFDDQVYVSLQLDKAGRHAGLELPVAVSALFSFINTDGQLAEEKLVPGKYDGNELFLRTTVRDYDIIKVSAVVEIGGTSSELSSAVKKQ